MICLFTCLTEYCYGRGKKWMTVSGSFSTGDSITVFEMVFDRILVFLLEVLYQVQTGR